MADSVILGDSTGFSSWVLWTQDAEFKGLQDVRYVSNVAR